MKTLLVNTIRSTCKKDYDHEQINAWISSAEKKEHWDKFINTQFSLVAEVEGKAVGFGSLENGGCIYFLYVAKDYLGRGIASGIYKQLEKKSQRLDCAKITANVSKTALPFFKNKGFKVVKENKNLINGVEIINYHMVHDFSA